ncbi:MAG: adenylyltransferase/cytidyltransferase family protein [Rickettsiales endosymbiont of Dermacentor nuttalli]
MHKIYYDFLVFIGRFQPFHNGHRKIVLRALELANNVIILCGSARQPRSIRNPWLVEEREQMIRCTFSDVENQRIIVSPLIDILYNDVHWVDEVRSIVEKLLTQYYNKANSPIIGLIGHSKDYTSYYLNLFPEWESENVENYQDINATVIRDKLFTGPANLQHLNKLIPECVCEYLEDFMKSEEFAYLLGEYNFIQKYKDSWKLAPYPPIFVTVDVLVVQSNNIIYCKA